MTQEIDSKTLLAQIEAGIERVANDADFQRYLKLASSFHKYSMGNLMLIAWQKPDATQVAGFHHWLKIGRAVRKGEKGIRILAPMMFKAKNASEDDDDKGTRIAFKVVSVFDVSQTEGEDLPEPKIATLAGDSAGLFDKLAAIATRENLTLSSDPALSSTAPGAKGFYSRSGRLIWVSPEYPGLQRAKTLAHELGHHFAEHEENGHNRPECETIAEAVAYIVMNSAGFDSGDYSFGYLATWAAGETKVFKAKLAEIVKTSAKIIDGLGAVDEIVESAAA
jgi:antirestriction protein ArdC